MCDSDVIEINSLRHLDALVAERLIGWQWWIERSAVYWLLPPDFLPGLNLRGWERCDRPYGWPGPNAAEFRYGHGLPHYSGWGGLESVIRNRGEAGCGWSIDRRCPVTIATVVESIYGESLAEHPHPPIAFCLAALDSAGCRVRLELNELVQP
jgi:hypothetical protein